MWKEDIKVKRITKAKATRPRFLIVKPLPVNQPTNLL